MPQRRGGRLTVLLAGLFAKWAEEFSCAPPDQPLMAQSGKRRMRQVQETRRILKMMIPVKKLFQHEEQSHLEPADGLHGVPPCLIKLEGLAGPDVVFLSLVADDGFAIQREDKRFAGRGVL